MNLHKFTKFVKTIIEQNTPSTEFWQRMTNDEDNDSTGQATTSGAGRREEFWQRMTNDEDNDSTGQGTGAGGGGGALPRWGAFFDNTGAFFDNIRDIVGTELDRRISDFTGAREDNEETLRNAIVRAGGVENYLRSSLGNGVNDIRNQYLDSSRGNQFLTKFADKTRQNLSDIKIPDSNVTTSGIKTVNPDRIRPTKRQNTKSFYPGF